ncbi:DNA-binding protein [Pleomorphomonas diazotrophica]|uniref:DNA-binding protein n=1 Tax=Pleomorphomonas diazotrophica TaxID=1166257 RepID=A0A1I4W6W5_9HYPH|nr:helix-turn-helix domain-containing protein [Pleomorphomonas diazotrophica]PKR87918.1 DNA-binding protein [Pleomorphomonas diazotrophica]SFN09195.1 DNA binding domain-containing protein, excisionase family [Pleomorphomonas diazotrophica]
MANPLLTVEEAAEALKLHPKTVLRHIREGRLEATRIGKAYRIDRAKLDAFAGVAKGSAQPAAGARATVIVDVPDMTVEAAERLATLLGAAALSGDAESRPLTINTAFDPATGAFKVVLIAAPVDAARMLEMIEMGLSK